MCDSLCSLIKGHPMAPGPWGQVAPLAVWQPRAGRVCPGHTSCHTHTRHCSASPSAPGTCPFPRLSLSNLPLTAPALGAASRWLLSVRAFLAIPTELISQGCQDNLGRWQQPRVPQGSAVCCHFKHVSRATREGYALRVPGKGTTGPRSLATSAPGGLAGALTLSDTGTTGKFPFNNLSSLVSREAVPFSKESIDFRVINLFSLSSNRLELPTSFPDLGTLFFYVSLFISESFGGGRGQEALGRPRASMAILGQRACGSAHGWAVALRPRRAEQEPSRATPCDAQVVPGTARGWAQARLCPKHCTTP